MSYSARPARRLGTLPPLTSMVLLAVAGTSWAGRPLAVDDANTNEQGAGHVEAWVERAGGATAVTVAGLRHATREVVDAT